MRLLLCFALTCLSSFAIANPSSVTKTDVDCGEDLLRFPQAVLEDPITNPERRGAREAARAVAPHLSAWAIRESDFHPELVERTFAEMRRAGVDVDGAAMRSLFMVVQRFLVATLDFEARLAALAHALHVDGATVGRLVNLFLQLDARAYSRDIPKSAPQFLRDALEIKSFVKAELGDEISAPAKSFLYWKFNEVVRQRLRYARLSLSRDRRQLIVRTPIGVYRINLTDRVFERPAIAEPYVSRTDAFDRADDRVIHAQIEISTADAEAALYLRTAIRADAFLHPHASLAALKKFPQPTVTSDWQESEVVDPLLKLDEARRRSHGMNGPILLGLMMPVGTGKTPSGTAYLNRVPLIGKAPGVRTKHVVIVENTHLLRQAMASYQRDTGARPEKMAMLFGEDGIETLRIGSKEFEIRRGRKLTPPMDWDVIFITRSTFIARRSSLEELIRAENRKPPQTRRPFRVTIDEGQHTGTEDGQFEAIFDFLDQNLTSEDRVLIVSATLDHAHLNIVRDRLGGAVVAPLLLPDELASLRRGENVMIHARVQFIRAMIAGLINPIDPRSVAGKSDERRGGYTEELKRDRSADRTMYEFTADTIRTTRSPGGSFDRGLIFEPVKERANKGAEFLTELFRGNTNRRVAWYAHSDLSNEEGARRIDWLRGTKEFLDTGTGHKYLTSVSQFLEGLDVPEINLLVVMRNFQSLVAMMQLLGRGARIDAFKTSSRLIDLPGRVMQWLEEADILWLRASSVRPGMIATWDKPILDSIELLEKPDQDLLIAGALETRPIQLEPIYAEERKRLAAWQEIRERDLVLAADAADGVLALLQRNPEDTERLERVNPSSWFGHFYAQFPGEVRTEWFPQWQQLKLENRMIDPAHLSGDQRRAAIRGFRLLGRMFNGLSDHRDRLGFADLEKDEELSRSGFARLRLGLKRRPVEIPHGSIPRDLSPLAFGAADYAQIEDLRESLAEGLLFAHSSPSLHREILKQASVPSAWDALGLVVKIFAERPALAKAVGDYLTPLHARVATITDAFEREIAATYALALLVNVIIHENHLEASKPWDLHALVGRRNGHDVLVDDVNDRPTFHDLMMTLDFADSRLGGAELANAVEEKVEIVPAPDLPPPVETETPSTGSFSPASIERLTGPDGTLPYLRRTRGRGKLREPEALLSQMLNHALYGNDPAHHAAKIVGFPDESETVRMAHALVEVENYYRATSPRDRVGLPAPVPLEIFDAPNFQRMMQPLMGLTFTLPIAFDAASVNAHLPFQPLSALEADSLERRFARLDLFDDTGLREFVGAELPRLARLKEPLNVLELVVDLLKEAPWAYSSALNLEELAAHVTRLRRTPADPVTTRAFAVAQLAWVMNALIVHDQANLPLWSLASLSPLPDRERHVEEGLLTSIKVYDLIETLSRLLSRPGAKAPRPGAVDPDRPLDIYNWSTPAANDLASAKIFLDGLFTKGVREFDLAAFLKNRHQFAPEIEVKFKMALQSQGLSRRALTTDTKKLKPDELASIARAVRLLGALYNGLSEVDRLGAPPMTHRTALSLARFGDLSKVFNVRFGAPAKLSIMSDRMDRRIEGMSPEWAELWREAMVGDRLFGGYLSDRFAAWVLRGFGGEPAEALEIVVDQIRAHPRLLAILGEPALPLLESYVAQIRAQRSPKDQTALYVAISHLVNYLVRDAVRDERPWDTALAGERATASAGTLERPSWHDVIRVLHKASLIPIDANLAAYGITAEELTYFADSRTEGTTALAHIHLNAEEHGKPASFPWKRFLDDLRSAFPPHVLAAHKAKLATVDLPTARTAFPNSAPKHVRAIAHALLVFQDVFNGMNAVERLGMARLNPKAILTSWGLNQLMVYRNGYVVDADLVPVDVPRLAAGLRDAAGARGRFEGVKNASEALVVVHRLARESRNFGGRLGAGQADFMAALVGRIESEGGAVRWEERAALTLSRVVNELIRALGRPDLKPWNSGEAGYSMLEFLEPVDRAEYNVSPTLADLTAVMDLLVGTK